MVLTQKIVPSNIQDLLTPRGLAYWIMDDGSLQNKGLHLNTYGAQATNQDVLNFKYSLENMSPAFLLCPPLLKRGIAERQGEEKIPSFDPKGKPCKGKRKCSIHKHKKGDRIYIWGISMDVIRHNINKFMHKNMLAPSLPKARGRSNKINSDKL